MSESWELPQPLELESVNIPDRHEIRFGASRWFLTSVEVWNTMLVVHMVEAVAGDIHDTISMMSATDENGTLYEGRGGGGSSSGPGGPGMRHFELDRPLGSKPTGATLSLAVRRIMQPGNPSAAMQEHAFATVKLTPGLPRS